MGHCRASTVIKAEAPIPDLPCHPDRSTDTRSYPVIPAGAQRRAGISGAASALCRLLTELPI